MVDVRFVPITIYQPCNTNFYQFKNQWKCSMSLSQCTLQVQLLLHNTHYRSGYCTTRLVPKKDAVSICIVYSSPIGSDTPLHTSPPSSKRPSIHIHDDLSNAATLALQLTYKIVGFGGRFLQFHTPSEASFFSNSYQA
jgi:hypothetical protein